jgi:hypothetical protein
LQSLYAQSLKKIKNVFACSKHSNFESGQSLFFSNILFFTKCKSFLLKIGKDFNILTLMIKRAKGLELMIFFLYNPFEHIWFKKVFAPKNYGFENVPLTKVVNV